MESMGKSLNNYLGTLRYNPLSIRTDKKQNLIYHALRATTGPISTEGRLYFNRPLPGQNQIVPVQRYDEIAKSIIEIRGPNGSSLVNKRYTDINLDVSGFAEPMHDYNLIQDWSDSNMVKKGIVPYEILLRREKVSSACFTDLIEKNNFIILKESLADRLGDTVQSGNITDNGFYGQYVPISRLMCIDDSLCDAYRDIYNDATNDISDDLRGFISPTESILHQSPVVNFLRMFDVIGAYIRDDIQKDPTVVCETIQYVSRGSIYLAKESHLLNFKTGTENANLAIPSECFLDLDIEENDFSTGDMFYTYLCIFSENSRLRIRVVKSKKTENFVTHKINAIYCSSKTHKQVATHTGLSQLFNSNKYVTNVAIQVACKRIGMSTVGAINDDDYLSVNNVIGIKRFYLDIGNHWYKI